MWILQSNLVKESQVRPFAEAFRDQGIEFQDVAIVPFADQFMHEPNLVDQRVIPYGTTTLMRIAIQRGWRGLFWNDQFQAPMWSIKRRDMLNQDAVFMTARQAQHDFTHERSSHDWFVRPTEDFKAFSGTVGSGSELAALMAGGEGSQFNFTPDTMVAISHPKEILQEWRYFVVGGKVISGSTYRMNGARVVQRETDASQLEIAQRLADVWLPHPVCVMDVARTGDGHKVVEFNCLNASGVYDHDVPSIVRAVTDWFGSGNEASKEHAARTRRSAAPK